MAISMKLLFFAAIFLVIYTFTVEGGAAAAATCSIGNIVVSQAMTGRVVEGKPEFQVTVRNNCRCSQSAVIVKCFGLSSVENVNTAAIRPIDGVNCIVNGGRPIVGASPVVFTYAWMTPQDFPLVSSNIQC